eukprot:15250617-Alexandrium_andersonii.AAC.1
MARRQGGGACLGLVGKELGARARACWKIRHVPSWPEARLRSWLEAWGWTEVEVLAPPQSGPRGSASGWLVKAVAHELGDSWRVKVGSTNTVIEVTRH